MRTRDIFKAASVLLAALVAFLALSCDTGHVAKPESRPGSELAGPYSNFPDIYKDRKSHTYSLVGEDDAPCVSLNGMLSYSSTNHSMNSHIYAKPVDGTAVSMKTTGPASEMQPKFSPDGKRLSFTSDRNGNWDIFVLDVENPSSLLQVTFADADEIHPTWSPDGTKIAYCSKSMSGVWELWVADLSTRSFTNVGPGLFPEWCPIKGSNKLLFQKPRTRGDNQFGLWTVDTDGNNLTEVVSSDKYATVSPCWAPDGQWIAFTRIPLGDKGEEDSSRIDIFVVSIDGLGVVPMVAGSDPEWNPFWGRDGRIYFVSKKEGKQNIWSIMPILPDLSVK